MKRRYAVQAREILSTLAFAFVAMGCTSSSPGGASPNALLADIGGTQVSCANADVAPDGSKPPSACDECGFTLCKSEYQAVFGRDPRAFGGVCAAVFNCVCACTSDECIGRCASTTMTTECAQAVKAADSCEDSKCRASCGSTVTSTVDSGR
jgi:hypothetical protein